MGVGRRSFLEDPESIRIGSFMLNRGTSGFPSVRPPYRMILLVVLCTIYTFARNFSHGQKIMLCDGFCEGCLQKRVAMSEDPRPCYGRKCELLSSVS